MNFSQFANIFDSTLNNTNPLFGVQGGCGLAMWLQKRIVGKEDLILKSSQHLQGQKWV